MGKSLVVALASLLLLAAVADAGTGASSALGIPGLKPSDGGLIGLKSTTKGLFDASRFSLQHTLGVSFRSGSSGGMDQYYLSTITYKAAKPLTIQAEVGIQNNLYGTPAYGSSRGGSAKIFLPRVGVLYQPSPNIRIELQFSNQPAYNGYDRFGWRGYPY